jgi:hypothetical protein
MNYDALALWPKPSARALLALADKFPSELRAAFVSIFTEGLPSWEIDRYLAEHPEAGAEMFEALRLHGEVALSTRNIVWVCRSHAPDGRSLYAIFATKEPALEWLQARYVEQVSLCKALNESLTLRGRLADHEVTHILPFSDGSGWFFDTDIDRYLIERWPILTSLISEQAHQR